MQAPLTWTYGDWRRQTSDVAKRDRLILHIEEVERWVVSAHGRGGRVLELQREYLPMLEGHLEKLEAKIERAGSPRPRRVRLDFLLVLFAVLTWPVCNSFRFEHAIQKNDLANISQAANSRGQ